MTEERHRPEGLSHFRALPLDDLYPRLLLAARGRIERAVLRGEHWNHAPGDRTEHDFVEAAVEKFLSGERRWNPDKTAFQNLWGAVSAEICDWVIGADDTTTSWIDDDKVVFLRADLPTPEDHSLWGAEPSRLLGCLRANTDKAEPNRLLRFLRHTTDRDVWRMAKLSLVYGLKGPEVAKRLGLERHEIDAARKRMGTMVTVYLAMGREVGPRIA